jgi:hypothetical protein
MSDRLPDVGWYLFTHDFVDSGVGVVADELAESGARHANIALVYHTARDLLPRNPRRSLRFMSGGSHYFTPDRSLYPEGVGPSVEAETAESDPVPGIRSGLLTRGLSFNAWVVFLHNSRAAMANPSLAQRNVFGDPMSTDLCPANPVVRAYARALATDVSRQAPDAVLAESLHFHGLRHGYHHERYLFELGALAELALSLCFCPFCVSAARTAGVNVAAVTTWAQDTVKRAFAGHPQRHEGELRWDDAILHAGGELGRYLEVRCATVESMVTEVREVLDAARVALVVLDPSGAVKGWADATPVGAPVHESGWQFGIQPRDVARAAGALEILGYTGDAARLADDLDGYRGAVGDAATLRMSLRPALPDTVDSDDLRRKIAVAAEAGISAIDLYHYGLLPPTAVTLVRDALRPAEGMVAQ